MRRVRVTRWCRNPAQSRYALRKWLTTDENEIGAAMTSTNWSSPLVSGAAADAFINYLRDHRGEASMA